MAITKSRIECVPCLSIVRKTLTLCNASALADVVRAFVTWLTRRDGWVLKGAESIPVAGFLLALVDFLRGDTVSLSSMSSGGLQGTHKLCNDRTAPSVPSLNVRTRPLLLQPVWWGGL